MSKEPVQVEKSSADPDEPMLQTELANPNFLGNGRRAFPPPQPPQRLHHDLDASHLPGKYVTRQDPLTPPAAKADGQRYRADLERLECV